MSIISTFPRRPLELSWLPSVRGRVGWLLVLGFALFAFALVADLLYVMPPLIDDVMIGTSGKLAPRAGVAPGGECSISRGVLTDCHFEAVFKTDGSTEIHKSVRYFALFESIDDTIPFRVYYDPTDPERISTSWGRALLTNRVISQVLGLIVIVALLLVFPLAYIDTRRKRRSLLAMAKAPRPVVADFIRIRSARNVASVVFTWTDPESGTKRRETSRIPVTAEPFWLDRTRKTLLALAGPDGRAHALAEGLWPVILTDAERRALAEAMSSAAT